MRYTKKKRNLRRTGRTTRGRLAPHHLQRSGRDQRFPYDDACGRRLPATARHDTPAVGETLTRRAARQSRRVRRPQAFAVVTMMAAVGAGRRRASKVFPLQQQPRPLQQPRPRPVLRRDLGRCCGAGGRRACGMLPFGRTGSRRTGWTRKRASAAPGLVDPPGRAPDTLTTDRAAPRAPRR